MKISKIVFCLVFLFISTAQAHYVENKLIGKYYKGCQIIEVVFVPGQRSYEMDHYIIICMDKRNGILKQYNVYDFVYEDNMTSRDLYKLINKKEKVNLQ